jgi:hypothetical protein
MAAIASDRANINLESEPAVNGLLPALKNQNPHVRGDDNIYASDIQEDRFLECNSIAPKGRKVYYGALNDWRLWKMTGILSEISI